MSEGVAGAGKGSGVELSYHAGAEIVAMSSM
jgi:hypothetical protein